MKDPYSDYTKYTEGSDSYTLFSTGKCERCDAICCEPNAVGIQKSAFSYKLVSRMKLCDSYPCYEYIPLKDGSYGCSVCIEEGEEG